MKNVQLILTTLCLLFAISCSEDEEATAPVSNCTTLLATASTDGAAYATMYTAYFTAELTEVGTGVFDSDICTTYATSMQAAVTAGCTVCETGDPACLEDESNSDTCCDEWTQESVDEITASCTQ